MALLLAAGAVGLSGCGGDDAEDRAAAARTYAGQVAQATDATRTKLAEISAGADYRDAAAAASTTRAYATAIREAAGQLGQAPPPEAVARPHRELVALYRATADRLDAIATRFDAARGETELTALAQELSSEVGSYSSQETVLRGSIDAALTSSTRTTPAPVTAAPPAQPGTQPVPTGPLGADGS